MSGAQNVAGGVVFECHSTSEVELNTALVQVSAAPQRANANAAKRGAVIDIWSDVGRWRLRLDGDQLAWLRTELAKHAPRVEAVQ